MLGVLGVVGVVVELVRVGGVPGALFKNVLTSLSFALRVKFTGLAVLAALAVAFIQASVASASLTSLRDGRRLSCNSVDSSIKSNERQLIILSFLNSPSHDLLMTSPLS